MVQDSAVLLGESSAAWGVVFSANQRKVDLLFRRLALLEDAATPEGNVSYAALSELLRDKQILDFPEQFQSRGWIVSPLGEVRLLEILHLCWRDQRIAEERKEFIPAREGLQMDAFNRSQICVALARIASECMISYDPHAMFHANEKEITQKKVQALLELLCLASDDSQLPPTSPSRHGTAYSLKSTRSPSSKTPTRPKTVAEGFLDQWRSSTAVSELRPHSAGVPRPAKAFPVAKRPASQYSNRLGTTSSPTSQIWGGSRRDLSSSIGSGGEREWEEPSTGSRKIKTAPPKLPAWAFASVGKQAIRDAIEIINPHDSSWQITQESLRSFLEQRMKLTPVTCKVLQDGALAQMFLDTDLDRDGVVTLEELAFYLASPPRFKRHRHGATWKEIISMACSVRLAKHHHTPNVYLYPVIEVWREAPPDRNPIYAQFQRPSNYPPHCGYGPVSRGEYKLEQSAGMLARSIAWEKTAGYPHQTRIGTKHSTSTTPTIVHPLETPSLSTPYVSPVDMSRMSRPDSMASRVGTPLPSRPTTSSSRATKPSRLSSAAPSSRRGMRSHRVPRAGNEHGLHTPSKAGERDHFPMHRLGTPLTEPVIPETEHQGTQEA